MTALARRSGQYLALAIVALAAMTGTVARAALIDPIAHGARGDGWADDLPALRRAVAAAAVGDTIDGQGRTFRVRGSLRIDRSLTLARMRLQQELEPGDVDAAGSLRTIFVRPPAGHPSMQVHLREVSVDRGRQPHHGHPGDAAGIWLERVSSGSLEDVTVTGHGRGAGVVIVEADGLRADRLRVADMVWAPCAGRPGVAWETAALGWNRVRIHPLHACANDSAEPERIQEPLSGVVVLRSRGVVFRALQIRNLHARFGDGRTAPWQTDGLSAGTGPRDSEGLAVDAGLVIEDAQVSGVWEGIDLTGAPLQDVTVRRAHVHDVHAIGIKVANGTRRVRIEDSLVERAGLAGYAVGGLAAPVQGARASGALRVLRSRAVDTGLGGLWSEQRGRIAGFRIMRSAYSDPDDIVLESAAALASHDSAMDHGLLLECGGSVRHPDFASRGHRSSAIHTDPGACRHRP